MIDVETFVARLLRFPVRTGEPIGRFYRSTAGERYRVSRDGAVWDGAGGSPVGIVISEPRDPRS